MTNPTSPDVHERRKIIWARVYQALLRHAIPDSRFNLDFLAYTPDFRGSASAIDRVRALPCYKSATTILVTSDNCLEQLRFHALKDGKKVLVATYRLRRGFVLLDPGRIDEGKFEMAACLDGMEKKGIGRPMSIAQLMDEDFSIGMCAIGGLAFSEDGVIIWEGQALFEVQWALLQDIKLLTVETPVVAVAHNCQVVDESAFGVEKIIADKTGEVQCDFVVTPEKVYEVSGATKPKVALDFDAMDLDAMNSIPPLQELRGIRMMEKIMKGGGFGEEKEKERTKPPTAEEQMGIDIVEKLMKNYKA